MKLTKTQIVVLKDWLKGLRARLDKLEGKCLNDDNSSINQRNHRLSQIYKLNDKIDLLEKIEAESFQGPVT